jgi:hypothetical protein
MTKDQANEAFARHVQQRLGLRVDGWAGNATRAAFDAAVPAAVPGAVVSTPAPAGIFHGASRTPVREIVVHCAATRPDWMQGRPLAEKVSEIRRWHRGNGWADIGYHWVIDRDGRLMAGRPETQIGAHTQGRNTGTIGVCLLGGHGSAASDRFAQNYTPEQDTALRSLIAAIRTRAQIDRISGHNEHAAKACPGFRVSEWLKGA